MIDKIYIESARSIRSEFLKLSKELDSYHKELADLFNYLGFATKDLENLNDTKVAKIKTQADITNVTETIIKKMNEIEAEEKKLLRLITPINDKIDKLRNEENYLYEQIKEKYPNMIDKEIVKEIQSQLEK